MKTVSLKLKNNKSVNIDFSPGDIVIDCGANVGDITAVFANAGALVIAYEPNEYAYDILSERFKYNSRVRCIKAAVLAESGKSKLFMHEQATEDPLKYSTGCSLLGDKQNVNSDDYVEVETIDLSEIIKKIKKVFNKNVQILKIDIEGAECELLEKLLDEGLLVDIPYIFVETHEKKIPSLRTATKKIIERIKKENLTNVNFNWI